MHFAWKSSRAAARRWCGVTLLAGLVYLTAPGAGAAGWPAFRGPTGDGHAPDGCKPPVSWNETNHIAWSTETPYRGWSTPAILGEQVWLTTATPDGKESFVLCLDATSGKITVNKRLFQTEAPEPLGNDVNCYATPSPAVEPGRVYVHFGSYGTACLDTRTAAVVWERRDLPCRHYRGPSSSPILFEQSLSLTLDGADLQYLIALDKATGKTLWKTDRTVPWNDENVPGQMARDGDLRKAHSTPLIVTVEGKPLLLSAGAKAAYGYDPRTGKELWQVRHPAWSAAPVPVYRQGLAYFITGAGKTELLAVRVGGQGNVTDTHVAWRYEDMVAKTASPILVEDKLFMVSDEGMVTCLDAENGKQLWRSRLGGNYAASPLFAGGKLYFFSKQGKATVFEPGPELKVLATNSLPDGFMASPAVVANSLFLRTRTRMYRVD
jgi:outer membrane protein assembly factor BamB